MNAEEDRVAQNDRLGERWDLWGPYLSERAWGTVREDYSATGDAWDYFPHGHARSRAYRWSEDVKELYWYIDNTPSHSFMRMIYRYPHAAFPYEELIKQSAARSKSESEFELWDTAALENGFFDIEIEYAKNSVDDILIRATATNCGSKAASLHI